MTDMPKFAAFVDMLVDIAERQGMFEGKTAEEAADYIGAIAPRMFDILCVAGAEGRPAVTRLAAEIYAEVAATLVTE